MLSDKASSADNQQERFKELRLDKSELDIKSLDLSIGSYISGFVDGDGSFNVSLRKNSDYRLKWQPVLSFNVSQKYPQVLLLIQRTLGCGIIKCRKCDGLYSYDVTNPGDVIDKVIPFFEKFRFITPNKNHNFDLFREIALIMSNKKHLEKPGLLKILQIREELNKGLGRKRKYTLVSVFP